MDGYLERKFREIALLNDCLASPATLRRPVSAVDAIETKFRLAAAIKAEQVTRNWSATETARIPAPHAANGAFEFSYGYQRADLAVRWSADLSVAGCHRRGIRGRNDSTLVRDERAGRAVHGAGNAA
jgi:hypothetical protein